MKNTFFNKNLFTFLIFLIINIVIVNLSFSQTIGINQANPDTSSILDIYSKDKGLLIPRLTTTEQELIPSPAKGLIIYNTTVQSLIFWDGNSWELINSKSKSNITNTGPTSSTGVAFNISENPADPSAALDVNSDGTEKKGFLLTRTSTASIITPTAVGLIIYNTANDKISFFDGSTWQSFCSEYVSSNIGVGSFISDGIGINTTTIDPSAILELSSTEQGLLIPRMLSTERDNIISPASGLMIYNLTDNSIDIYNGTEWRQLLLSVPTQPGVISGNINICENSTNETYSITNIIGASSYVWTVPADATIISGQGTNSINVDFAALSGNICVSAVNGCGTSSNSCQAITILKVPLQPGVISGNTPLCENTTGENYSIVSVGGASSYNWTIPTGATITSGLGTTSINVDFGSSSGSICVSASNVCGTSLSNCQTITIDTESSVATSINTTDNNICNGTSVDLSVVGGSLGTSASWEWYTASCGGTSVGTGALITVTPASTTTYYVRAEGTCNTTACQSITITISGIPSVTATSINTTDNNICNGTSVDLSIVGGTLGTGASWEWYTASCGGTSVGTGASITVTPTSTTTYYVRAEGTCNTTTCQNITITVGTAVSPPTSLSATISDICVSQNTTLSFIGGAGDLFKWYTGSCGGTIIGTANNLTVSPSIATTYYGEWTSVCGNSGCLSITITVNSSSLSIAATSAFSNPNPQCHDLMITLSKTGGFLGTGAHWEWSMDELGGCGGLPIGNGDTINFSHYDQAPWTGSQTYYIRAVGDCNTTECVSVKVISIPEASCP